MKHLLGTASAAALLLGGGAAAAQGFDLGEIVVTATATPIEDRRIGISIESLDSGDALAVPGDLQLSDALRRAPGINIVQNGPAGTTASLLIRGAQERYTAVYVDGIKVNDPSSTSGQYGNFGAFGLGAVSRVEVLKGSQSALHGGSAVAGVVNLFTFPDLDAGDGDRQRAEIMFGSFGTAAASYSFTRTRGDWAMAFGLSHFRTDGFSAGDENRGNTEDDSAQQTRFSFGLAWQANDILRVGLNGFYATGEEEFDEGTGLGPVDGTPGDETGTRDEIGLRAFATIDTGGAWTHDLAVSWFNVDRSQISRTVAAGSFLPFASRFEGERRRFDWQSTGQIGRDLRLSFGADFEKLTSKDTSIPGGRSDTYNRGVFTEAIFSPMADLDIVATLRHDDNSQFGGATTGRLAVSYRPSDALTLRGMVATGFRPPVPSELFSAFPDPLYPFFGNPALAPEDSESVELGFDLAVAGGNGVFSATLFRNEIDNLVQFSPCPVTLDFVNFSCDPGTFSTLVNVPGTTTYQGVELNYEHAITERVVMSLAYTYLDAATAAGAKLPRVAEHDLFLGLDLALTDRLSSQIGITHQAGRAPDTSPVQPLPDFTVVDLGFEYDVTDRAQAYVAVKNLFDEQYQQIAGYGTADRSVYFGFRAEF